MNRQKSIVDTNLYKEVVKRKRKVLSKTEKIEEGIDEWTSFYRANPHRFVEDFLGIQLKLFQQILLYIMMHFNFFTYIAARGCLKLALPIGNFRVIKLGNISEC